MDACASAELRRLRQSTVWLVGGLRRVVFREATAGIEPAMKALQTSPAIFHRELDVAGVCNLATPRRLSNYYSLRSRPSDPGVTTLPTVSSASPEHESDARTTTWQQIRLSISVQMERGA